jgi:hypothetical protein
VHLGDDRRAAENVVGRDFRRAAASEVQGE